MKPTVSKIKNIRGRITGYVAYIGEVRAEGKTPKEASEKCEREAYDALARLDYGPLLGTWRGHAYVISPTITGWEYWIDTFSRVDYSVKCETANTREDVRWRALSHMAQNLWTVDVNDDEFLADLPSSVVDTLKSWIRFQREYARLAKEGGRSDSEIHRLACEASYREPNATDATPLPSHQLGGLTV